MNYKYTIPIFEAGDEDEALDVIASELSSGASLHIETGNPMAIDDDEDDDDIIDFKELSRPIFRSVAKNAYGENENIILMANFIQTQKFYHQKARNHLMKYLFHRGVKFKEIGIDMAKIANDKIRYEAICNPKFRPVSRWNPHRIWTEDEFEYSSSYDPINLTNPLNVVDHLSLEFDDGKEICEFAKATNDDTLRYLQCDGKVYLRLLPYASPVHLINIMEAAYKVF